MSELDAFKLESLPQRGSKLGMGGHHSAVMEKEVWLTPPEVLRALGPFDLDPCSPIGRPWDTARAHFTILDDGLIQPWSGRVWLNPPYGPHTSKWMHRLWRHGNGVALIFARTETATWFDHIWPYASGILFLKGRLHFHHITGRRAAQNAGAPSALIAYGPENARILRECGLAGYFVSLRGDLEQSER